MMLLAEFGGSEADSPDEITRKKLAYIEERLLVVNESIRKAKLNPNSKTYDKDMSFFTFTLARHQTEKFETLRDIGHSYYSGATDGCRCIYCIQVIPNR